MSNAASYASSAANKFRQAQNSTTDPAIALIAEGLKHLADAVRDLDQAVDQVEYKVRKL